MQNLTATIIDRRVPHASYQGVKHKRLEALYGGPYTLGHLVAGRVAIADVSLGQAGSRHTLRLWAAHCLLDRLIQR